VTKFVHDGSVDWSCSTCGKTGSFSFDGLETSKENPTRDDYIIVIARAEAEHAIYCSGSLEFEGAFRHRFVELQEGKSS